jgi:hypothetical protein
MAYTVLDRSLQQAMGEVLVVALGEGPLAPAPEAFNAGQMLLAIGLIFAINLLVATFLFITLPSLVVPFSGLLLAGLRALVWGILFAPEFEAPIGMADLFTWMLLALLLFLEGQGYVLATLGAYLHGRAFLWPRSVGETSIWRGYWAGLKTQARIYVLIAVVLLVAAVYEVAMIGVSVRLRP